MKTESYSKEVNALKESNKLLKEHIAFLRKRIDEKDSIIEMYSETVLKMEEIIQDKETPYYKFFLN